MSDHLSNRKLNIEGKIESSVIIVGNDNFASILNQGLPSPEHPDNASSPASNLPKTPNPLERLKLIQTLNALPTVQFDEIVFALNPPSGNIPGNSTSQDSRSKALLTWLESSMGPGLVELELVLASIAATQKQTERQNQLNQQLRTLVNELKTSQAPKYDLRGATFGGGFAETVQGDQIGRNRT